MGKLITDYFKWCEEYQDKYGERTIVLLQKGTFYNTYEYDPDKDNSPNKPVWPSKRIGHSVLLSNMIHVVLTKNNNHIDYGFNNPNMLGFPVIAYHKHKNIILSNDYTIVRIDEKKKKHKDDKTERFVAEIISPATVIDDTGAVPVSNSIVSLYIEVQKQDLKLEDYLIICGISSIDVTTGENMVSEIYSQPDNAIYALQEIYRYLLSISPREILVHLITSKKTDTEINN